MALSSLTIIFLVKSGMQDFYFLWSIDNAVSFFWEPLLFRSIWKKNRIIHLRQQCGIHRNIKKIIGYMLPSGNYSQIQSGEQFPFPQSFQNQIVKRTHPLMVPGPPIINGPQNVISSAGNLGWEVVHVLAPCNTWCDNISRRVWVVAVVVGVCWGWVCTGGGGVLFTLYKYWTFIWGITLNFQINHGLNINVSGGYTVPGFSSGFEAIYSKPP